MVERLYPGVYVTETSFQAHPIEGVSTATMPLASAQEAQQPVAHASSPPAPGWTQQTQHDPGTALAQLFAFLGESLLFRCGGGASESMLHAQPGYGVVQGLAVDSHTAGDAGVHVAAGEAWTPRGRPVDTDSAQPHRIKKP